MREAERISTSRTWARVTLRDPQGTVTDEGHTGQRLAVRQRIHSKRSCQSSGIRDLAAGRGGKPPSPKGSLRKTPFLPWRLPLPGPALLTHITSLLLCTCPIPGSR